MVVKIANWNIRDSQGIHKFDLHETYIAKGEKSKGDVIERPFAFGITFGRCMQIIVQETMKQKYGDLDLIEFQEAYEKTTEQMMKFAEESILETKK